MKEESKNCKTCYLYEQQLYDGIMPLSCDFCMPGHRGWKSKKVREQQEQQEEEYRIENKSW